MWPCDHGWTQPSLHPSLSSGEIHVWSFSLDASPLQLTVLSRLLSADERERAARFHFEQDRCHYTVAHAVLRQLLSRYTGHPPGAFQFDQGPNGKPSLPAAYGGEALQFNLSHSHNLGLIAVANHRELGVDLEWIRPMEDMEQVATHFFSAREREQLFQLEAGLRLTAFYHCWTRKEAYIKACGDGLSMPLDQFDVNLRPGEPAGFLAIKGSTREAQRWFLRGLLPAANFVGAVAVPGPDWTVKCWNWADT